MNSTMNVKYSVAIRTLGTAGEKYIKLLKSIDAQTIKPEKVIVVLPEGYSDPEPILGYEEFVHSPKGMIIQRLFALNYIDSEYVLFSDDDIEFESCFIEKVLDSIINFNYDCASGPLLELFPPNTLKYTFASVLGGACRMVRNKEDMYTRILSTGGWSYNYNIDIKHHKFYNAESLPWACFIVKTKAMKAIQFQDEMWFEKNGYSAFEDRGMFYKLLLNGYKTCVVSDAKYIHNDAKTSNSGNNYKMTFCGTFNHYVFWHRYLYSQSSSIRKKLWLKICINYYIIMGNLNSFVNYCLGRCDKETFRMHCLGFREAKKYIKSSEYNNLKPVVVKKNV